jgi:hypothetical protein
MDDTNAKKCLMLIFWIGSEFINYCGGLEGGICVSV